MNLQELQENKKTRVVKRALREHYELDLDFEKLSGDKARKLLKQVKGLINEAKKHGSYNGHNDSTYIKLIMVEQALSDRLSDLRNPLYRVVVENEEVQKSQVILAAQDLVDSLQKMLEDVSKMNVEELNAVVDGMKNEFGVVEGNEFGQSVGATLSTLQAAIADAKASVVTALGMVTGEIEGGEPISDIGEPADTELDTGMQDTEQEQSMELDQEQEPEQEPVTQAAIGRARRP